MGRWRKKAADGRRTAWANEPTTIAAIATTGLTQRKEKREQMKEKPGGPGVLRVTEVRWKYCALRQARLHKFEQLLRARSVRSGQAERAMSELAEVALAHEAVVEQALHLQRFNGHRHQMCVSTAV